MTEELVDSAICIAAEAHRGQRDRSGFPVFGHPFRVMMEVRKAGYSTKHQTVAILHDVIEDSKWDADLLRRADIPEDVVDAVVDISRTNGEPYSQYFDRVLKNDMATIVKFFDAMDNLTRAPEHSTPNEKKKYLSIVLRASDQGGGLINPVVKQQLLADLAES